MLGFLLLGAQQHCLCMSAKQPMDTADPQKLEQPPRKQLLRETKHNKKLLLKQQKKKKKKKSVT